MTTEFTLLHAQFPAFTAAVAFAVGSLFGSFINVVVYRLPIMLERAWHSDNLLSVAASLPPDAREGFNLIFPRSRCPRCLIHLQPWHMIPVLGYFLVRRVCTACHQPVSARYPTVEMATGLLTALVIMQLGVTPEGMAGCILTWALLSLALIDYDTRLLPDSITLPMIWLGLLVNLPRIITTLEAAVVGACLGYLLLWCVYHLFKLVTGKEGMGFGDFKLLAMLGAWLGWQTLPLILLLASLLGAGVGGILILRGHDRSRPIPFGPCLAAAGWVALLRGEEIMLAWQMMNVE